MMKTRLLRLSVLMLAFTMTSCDQILDNYWDRKAQEQYVSPYKGTYKGNYSGDEVGTITIEVTKNGYTSLVKTSKFGTDDSFSSGKVMDDGSLYSVRLQSGFTLLGNLNTKSGTWKMGEWNGNWSVLKQ